MVISRKRLRQLLREMEFQLRRVQGHLCEGKPKTGLQESDNRFRDIYALLVALYMGKPIEVIDTDETTTTQGKEATGNVRVCR